MSIKGNAKKKNVIKARQIVIYLTVDLMTRDRLIVANSFKRYNATTFHFIADLFGLYDIDRNNAEHLFLTFW